MCTSPSLVDGPVKEPVEQGGPGVVAHREPESPDRVSLRVHAAHVVKPDDDNGLLIFHAFANLGQGCQMAKFDPFLSLDCARVEGVGAQSKERKGSNFAA